MPRLLRIAAVQMDATPAPLDERLRRAADLIAEAAASGAQLVVLPEVFNTGYIYADDNYALSETLDDTTVAWMKMQAATHGVHLTGSLLLRDGLDVYNSALLIAPDGRLWRYDKNYPWAWERAYFREGRGVTVADTALGRLGMLICWDYAHPDLWRQYAGRVDAIVMTSCPPNMAAPDLVLGDGSRMIAREEPKFPQTAAGTETLFGEDLDAWVRWLGVPLVNTTGAGRFRSPIPAASLTVGGMLAPLRPDLLEKLLAAPAEVALEADYIAQTKIVDGRGTVIARVGVSGDGLTLAEVALADVPPMPAEPEPTIGATSFARFFSDVFVPAVMTQHYRRGLRRQFGPRFAPVDSRTKIWVAALTVAFGAGWLAGSVRRG